MAEALLRRYPVAALPAQQNIPVRAVWALWTFSAKEILMTDKQSKNTPTSNELALERTRLASVRTEFALMRTGFSIASFGAGITELIGRSKWPDWSTDLFISVFLLVGMTFVQIGINRFRNSVDLLAMDSGDNATSTRWLKITPWLLQAALLAVLIFVHIN